MPPRRAALPLGVVVDRSGDDDVVARRGSLDDGSREHEGQRTGVAALVLGKERSERDRALPGVHPTEAQQVGPVAQPGVGAEGVGVAVACVDAEADDGLGSRRDREEVARRGGVRRR